MSDVETGWGTEFHMDNASGTLTELAEVLEVPLPSGAAELIRTSHMKTQGFHSYIATPLKDGEEADLVTNYIPGSPTDVLLREAKASGTPRDFKTVLLVDGDTWEITGQLVVRDYIRSNPSEDRRTATARVKWSGEVTEAAGA